MRNDINNRIYNKYIYCIINNINYDVLCNISFKEHLPEDGHNRWPKHVGGYAVL